MIDPTTSSAEPHQREAGNALILTLIVLGMLSGGVLLVLDLSSSTVRTSFTETRQVRAEVITDAASELVRAFLKDLAQKQNSLQANPFAGYETLHKANVFGAVRTISVDTDLNGINEPVGEYVVGGYVLGMDPAATDNRWTDPRGQLSHSGSFPSVYTTPPLVASASLGNDERQVVMTVTAAVPSFADPNREVFSKEICFSVSLDSSRVFDNAYFMHNWGWMSGSSDWVFNGNMRSNANFSWLGGCEVNGAPRFSRANSGVLNDAYREDDNGDGDQSNDGGTYAFRQVIGNAAVGSPRDRYDEDNVDISADQHHPGQVPMPNINNQAYYDELALNHTRKFDDTGAPVVGPAVTGSRLGVHDPSDPSADGNGYVWYDRSVGDVGKKNIVLVGTSGKPIIIDGPVVVRGSVMIRGVVKGQGGLYAKGNVYVAGPVEYADPPSSSMPSSSSTADINTWRNDNRDKTAFGLFTAGHMFFGKGAGPTSYFNDSANNNAEASAGQDKTNNTSDDNGGAGSSTWEVETYTAGDILLLNPTNDPSGPLVGDVIPGSGEDVDGDGEEDARTVMADLRLPGISDASAPSTFDAPWSGSYDFGNQRILDSEWIGVTRLGAGWSAADGGPRYRDAAKDANKLNGVFYSNHYLAGGMHGGSKTEVNGSLVARNEALYANSKFKVNHDARMIGGGSAFGFYLPRDWEPPRVIYIRALTTAE